MRKVVETSAPFVFLCPKSIHVLLFNEKRDIFVFLVFPFLVKMVYVRHTPF